MRATNAYSRLIGWLIGLATLALPNVSRADTFSAVTDNGSTVTITVANYGWPTPQASVDVELSKSSIRLVCAGTNGAAGTLQAAGGLGFRTLTPALVAGGASAPLLNAFSEFTATAQTDANCRINLATAVAVFDDGSGGTVAVFDDGLSFAAGDLLIADAEAQVQANAAAGAEPVDLEALGSPALDDVIRVYDFDGEAEKALTIEGLAEALLTLSPEATTLSINDSLLLMDDSTGAPGTASPVTFARYAVEGIYRFDFSSGSVGKYGSIANAMAVCEANDVVQLPPEVYVENVTVPAGCRLRAQDAKILGTVTLGDGAQLRGGIIIPQGGGADGISITGAASAEIVGTRVQINDATADGIHSDTTGAKVGIANVVIAGVFEDALHINGTAYYSIQGVFVDGTGTNGVHFDGTGTSEVSGLFFGGSSSVTNGILIGNSGSYELRNTSVYNTAVNAFVLGAGSDGAQVTLHNGSYLGSTWDFYQDPTLTGAGTRLITVGSQFRRSFAFFTSAWFAATETRVFHEDDGGTDDPGFSFLAQVGLGIPGKGAELIVGEGDSTTLGMLVYSTADDVTYTDDSAAAASRSGSLFDLPGTAVGNTLYVGNTQRKFSGFKAATTSALDKGATGAMAWEYWNGSAWVDLNVMCTLSDSPYTQLAEDCFEDTNAQHIRWNMNADWAMTTVDGTSAYWVRWRVTTAITTAPVFERWKLHTNRTEINSDGFTEYFGAGQPVRSLPWADNSGDWINGLSPANQDIRVSANITLNPIDNNFQDTVTDGRGGLFDLPFGVDTSRPLTFRVLWARGANTNAADIELQFIVSVFNVGDPLDNSNPEITETRTVALPTNANRETFVTEFEVDVSSLRAGDIVTFAYFRLGADLNDTYTSNVQMIQEKWSATYWAN